MTFSVIPTFSLFSWSCALLTYRADCKARMSEPDFIRFCDLLAEQPMLSAYATTPLTLSLLIQPFKHNQLATHAELVSWGMVMNRGALYEAGVLHMMDMSERREQRIAAGSKEVFPSIDVTIEGELWNFLKYQLLTYTCAALVIS